MPVDTPGEPTSRRSREVLSLRPFALFWSATTIRAFGSAIAGVAPDLMTALYGACRQQEVVYATELMDRLAPLAAVLAQDATPASLKYALGLLQLCSPRLRLPMVELGRPEKAVVTEAMASALGP